MLELGGAQQNTLHTVRTLDRNLFEVSLIAGSGGLLDAEAAGIEDLHFETCSSLVRSIRPAQDLRAFASLVGRFRRLRPHVVHTHSSKAGILGRAAAFLAGVPVIVHTVHGWGFNPLQTRRRQAAFVVLERICALMSSQLVCVSRANAAEGDAHGIARAAAFQVIRSGIRLRDFGREEDRGRLRADLGLSADQPLAGMIACLKQQKAPLDFVEVAARTARKLPGAHFVLAGDGVLREQVEEAVANSGLGERFHMLGWRRDPARVLADLDVLVLTSRHEGLPRVIPEAMASSKPVVVTAVDGSPEAVESGVSGYLCAPGDVEALSDRVCELLSDPEKARNMGLAGAQRVAPWDIDQMVRDQEALYRTLALEAGVISSRTVPA